MLLKETGKMKNFVKRDEIYLPPACQYNALNVIDKYYVKWHRETADRKSVV